MDPKSADATANVTSRNRRLILVLTGMTVVMFAFGFALVPLYGLLCQVAGVQSIAAQPESFVSAQSSGIDTTRLVTVKFDANVSNGLPWKFKPVLRSLALHPGETGEATFVASNLAAESITGQAIPNIVPWQATEFFTKIECFCFQQQVLNPHESREIVVRFMISPQLPEDIESLTLAYTFMNTDMDSEAKYRLQKSPAESEDTISTSI